MLLTKEQLSSVISKHAERENGLQDLMEVMLESMMLSERREYLNGYPSNKGNGFRQGRSYGQGRVLEFRIPRDRYGNFHPKILALLRDQENECERLAGSLYCRGMTQSQVGEVFGEIYGEQYSKASISRMIEYLRSDVDQWLHRSLESYYPVLFIDAIHIKIHRKRSVDTEAFYVALGVKEDKTREVLGIFNRPSESATGWEEMLTELKSRGLNRIGLLVADGLTGLCSALSSVYPSTPLQRCVTHLKRNMLNRVRHGDKQELSQDLSSVFRVGQPDYGREQAWMRWEGLCRKWGSDYRSIKNMLDQIDYKDYFTYLDFHPQIQSMIYTTNWIERLNKDFRRVLRMRGAMPNEESVLVLMGKTAMDKSCYQRCLPRVDLDQKLFPPEGGSFSPNLDKEVRFFSVAQG
jgi:transposase-like protein